MTIQRLLYAHRGAAAELPENTLPAFARAVEIGVGAIETDAHLSRDGHVVLAHDPTGRRMANRPIAWRDADLADIQAVDVGWGFTDTLGRRPFSGRGFRVPTLDEALSTFPTMRFNVDLKQATPSMVAPIMALVRRHRAEERVTLASFRLRTLLEVRQRGYGGDTALSQPEVAALLVLPRRAFRQLPFIGTAAQLPVAFGRVRLDTPAVIGKCHDLGMRVDYWTINEPDEARRLLALGADGIMSDHPAAVLPAM